MRKEDKKESETVSIETETKTPVEDLEKVRQRILELGGKHRKEGEDVLFQRNTYWDTSDERLTNSDQLIRVREVRRDSGTGKLITASVTWKGPREERGTVFKSQPEAEVEILDARDAIKFLKGLGFSNCVETFEKRIEHLELDGVKIDLNEIPALGYFVELEGSEQAIEELADELGLSLLQATSKNYEELLVEKFGDGADLRSFTFTAFAEQS